MNFSAQNLRIYVVEHFRIKNHPERWCNEEVTMLHRRSEDKENLEFLTSLYAKHFQDRCWATFQEAF